MIRKNKRGSQQGIALFMVISTLTLMSVLVAELTYSSQMSSRMAYNYVDGLKAYYLTKSAFKISLIRLKLYKQVKTMIEKNKNVKGLVSKSVIDQIWSAPFIFPLPIPKEASMSEADAVKDFMKESNLTGNFTANITSESSKLNLNNLFVKTALADPNGKKTTDDEEDEFKTPTAQPTPNPSVTPEPVNFREALDPAITALIEQRKNDDREFADIYRNVSGKDVVDAIYAYLFNENSGSNLPGFTPMKAKQAPLYSLSELHLIPGIDDELYSLLAQNFTVYSTPGVNVNTITKTTLHGLLPDLTQEELDQLMRIRDDPDVGKPWPDEKSFWESVATTSAAKNIDNIKAQFKKANIKIITEEESFKINVLSNVGLATRRLEAYVVVDNTKPKKNAGKNSLPGAQPQTPSSAADVTNNAQVTTAKKPTGLNLIYWRMM